MRLDLIQTEAGVRLYAPISSSWATGSRGPILVKEHHFVAQWSSSPALMEFVFSYQCWCTRAPTTVLLISIARFSVHILLLHHYKSDCAHTSESCSLVIELYLSEIREKRIKKRMTSSICKKFAHFWVVLVRKCMVQKFIISYHFDFLDRLFFAFFLIIPYELFQSFCSELNGQKWVYIVTITKW